MFNYVPKLCLNNLEASKRDKFTIATLSFFYKTLWNPKAIKKGTTKTKHVDLNSKIITCIIRK